MLRNFVKPFHNHPTLEAYRFVVADTAQLSEWLTIPKLLELEIETFFQTREDEAPFFQVSCAVQSLYKHLAEHSA